MNEFKQIAEEICSDPKGIEFINKCIQSLVREGDDAAPKLLGQLLKTSDELCVEANKFINEKIQRLISGSKVLRGIKAAKVTTTPPKKIGASKKKAIKKKPAKTVKASEYLSGDSKSAKIRINVYNTLGKFPNGLRLAQIRNQINMTGIEEMLSKQLHFMSKNGLITKSGNPKEQVYKQAL